MLYYWVVLHIEFEELNNNIPRRFRVTRQKKVQDNIEIRVRIVYRRFQDIRKKVCGIVEQVQDSRQQIQKRRQEVQDRQQIVDSRYKQVQDSRYKQVQDSRQQVKDSRQKVQDSIDRQQIGGLGQYRQIVDSRFRIVDSRIQDSIDRKQIEGLGQNRQIVDSRQQIAGLEKKIEGTVSQKVRIKQLSNQKVKNRRAQERTIQDDIAHEVER